MRDLILKRIAVIRETEHGFDRETVRWEPITIMQGLVPVHLADVDFSLLSDHELLTAFETILRRHYTQM